MKYTDPVAATKSGFTNALLYGLLLGLVILTMAPKSCQSVPPAEPMCVMPIECMGLPHVECDGNWSCNIGACDWVCGQDSMACATDPDCPVPLVCENGNCPPCPPNTTCEPCLGSCTDPQPELGECAEDDDCPGDHICSLSCPECPSGDANCGPCVGMCINDPMKAYNCEDNEDCADWETCEIVMCSNVPCDPSKEDCSAAKQCWGVCTALPLPLGSCIDDTDCDSDMVCQDNDCPPCNDKKGKGNDSVCPPCYGTCAPNNSAPTCVISGCSSQICAAEAMNSTCEWLPYYACFKLTTCEVLSDGTCGWVENDAYTQCLGGATPK